MAPQAWMGTVDTPRNDGAVLPPTSRNAARENVRAWAPTMSGGGRAVSRGWLTAALAVSGAVVAFGGFAIGWGPLPAPRRSGYWAKPGVRCRP